MRRKLTELKEELRNTDSVRSETGLIGKERKRIKKKRKINGGKVGRKRIAGNWSRENGNEWIKCRKN